MRDQTPTPPNVERPPLRPQESAGALGPFGVGRVDRHPYLGPIVNRESKMLSSSWAEKGPLLRSGSREFKYLRRGTAARWT